MNDRIKLPLKRLNVNERQYCCDRFSIYYHAYKRTFPNIRIVKYKSFVAKGENPYRFWITTGYKTFNVNDVMIQISYCPFCGENLFEFYNSDSYVNEIEGETFPMLK